MLPSVIEEMSRLICEVNAVSVEEGACGWESGVDEVRWSFSAGWKTHAWREWKYWTALHWKESRGAKVFDASLSFAVRSRGHTGRDMPTCLLIYRHRWQMIEFSTYWRCFSFATRHCSLSSTRSNGKPIVQLIFKRYDAMRPMPSFPWQTWWSRPSEFLQFSQNSASDRWLKVSCGVSRSSEFMTDQILSSLEPFGTESDKVFDKVLISLTSLMEDILSTENGTAYWLSWL